MKKSLITRIISALLVATMAFSLASCSDSGSKKKSSKKDRKDRVEKDDDRDDDDRDADSNPADSVSFTTLVDNDYYKISYGGIYTMECSYGDVISMYLLRFENKTDGVIEMATGHFVEETYTLLYGDLGGEDLLPGFAVVGEFEKPNFYVTRPTIDPHSSGDFYLTLTLKRGTDYYVPTEAEYSKHCRLYFDPTDDHANQIFPQCVLEIN
ncbi:MAG: hypothetical protein MJ108_08990 [Saccharofermentans sp.]|nr:hypothetical protein [Saccharofermentans sp.]